MTLRRENTVAPAGGPPATGAIARARLHEELRGLLAERMRAGLFLLVLAVVLFGVGDLLYHTAALRLLLELKGVYVAVALLAYGVLGRDASWQRLVTLALVVMVEVLSVAVMSDMLVDDVLTTFLLASILCLGTATLLPWGIVPQLACAVLAVAAVVAHVLLAGRSGSYYYPPVVATAMAAVTSVYIAGAFERHRLVRRSIEERLRESEGLKGAILDAALECIVTIDRDGRIVEFNAAAERAFGFRRDAVLGRPAEELLVPSGRRALHRRAVAGWVRSGRARPFSRRVETTALRADGTEFPVELAVVGIVQGDQRLLTAYLRDLTDRRLAEEGEASAVLVRVGREMMQLLHTGLIADHLGHVVRELFGCEHTVTLVRDAHDGAFLAGHGELHESARVEADVMDTVLARLDGDGVLALVGTARHDLPPAVTALAGDADTVLCLELWEADTVIGVHLAGFGAGSRPFTLWERRLACGIAQTASMAFTNARLVAELARASRIKSQFLSTMSHELRTPINVVLGYVEMAEDDEASAAERRTCLAHVRRAGRELLELVEGTLDVEKLEAGRSDVRLEPVSLRDFSDALHASCAAVPRRNGVPLVWSDDVPDVRVLTDARKLGAVVRNLVGNACKFTERGRVEVRLVVDAHGLRIVVVDTGIGIRPEDRELVFELYRQADGSETRRFGGTGVGLYIVRRFVQQLGGTVALESTPGAGTTFTVTVPTAPAPASRAA